MSRLNGGFRAFALCAVSASALMLAAASASAQYYPIEPAYPPPPPYGSFAIHEADAVVRSLGLTPITRPRRHGPFFIIVRAMGQEGTPVRVTLDRRSGRVIEIVRLGPGAPRVARIRPDVPHAYEYGPDDDDYGPEYGDDDLPPPDYIPGPRSSRPGSAPNVITREGIRSRDLPPPGSGPRVVTRDPDITGSVPRAGGRRQVDPLLGVPPEFRGRKAGSERDEPARLASRPPAEAIPQSAPLPRPRPANVPAVVQAETTPAAAAESDAPAATKEEASQADKSAPDWPPVQGFE